MNGASICVACKAPIVRTGTFEGELVVVCEEQHLTTVDVETHKAATRALRAARPKHTATVLHCPREAQHPAFGALCSLERKGPFATSPEMVTCGTCNSWPDLVQQAFAPARRGVA